MNRIDWVKKCNEWKYKWPVMQEEYLDDTNGLNMYAVIDVINKYAPDDAVFVCDAGSAYYIVPQGINLKPNQRVITSTSQADMGWALPASIGVAKAGAKNVICIVGDGSFMSNLQELAVIKEHELNIKIVILNNNGYLSIKNTQSRFYEGRVYGTSPETGVWFPEFTNVAAAFDMTYVYIEDHVNLDRDFELLLSDDDSIIFECICTQDQQILPAQSFKDGKQAPLHDMIPFLSDEELKREMIA